jgi:hypothetical protein
LASAISYVSFSDPFIFTWSSIFHSKLHCHTHTHTHIVIVVIICDGGGGGSNTYNNNTINNHCYWRWILLHSYRVLENLLPWIASLDILFWYYLSILSHIFYFIFNYTN